MVDEDARGKINGIEKIYFVKAATLSAKTKGRIKPIAASRKNPNRTDFQRDCHRILHSLPFRRLKHKTQVFFAPLDDHICTRMEHSLHVASVASTICLRLGLNSTLAEAIGMAHDLGHPPFGHAGEEALKLIHEKYKLPIFKHEAQSLRVIDLFKDKLHPEALNLTYEVRDGVVSHSGEKPDKEVRPDIERDIKLVKPDDADHITPATLEGCVVSGLNP